MKIDLTKLFTSLKATDTAKKSTTPKKKKSKKQVEAVVLGDVRRLADLPDQMSVEFLELYSDNLDEVLYPYVANKEMTIGYASRYKEVIIDNIFGNEHHLGMFHYLQERNTEGMSDKELVARAENLLMQGWHIRAEGPQYWLVNVDLSRIIEMTGAAPLAREVAALVFDESAAHIFLNESIASRFAALAKTIGHDADELAASGNLDLLLTRVTDNKFGGYIINYTAWRNILKKQTRYETISDGITPLDLYEQGYRLDSRITYPAAEKAVLTDGSNKYVVVPVMPDVSMETGVNKYQLAAIATKVKKDLLGRIKNIVVQDVSEIKELRHTFALMVEYFDSPSSSQTVSDTWDVLKRIQAHVDSGAVSETFGTRIMEALAAIMVTEAILLGDSHTTLAKVNIDSISGSIYCYNGLNYFTTPLEELRLNSGQEFNLSNMPLVMDDEALGFLIHKLPKGFLTALSSYEIDTSSYPGEFTALKAYFDKARQLILSKVGNK